MTRAYVYSRTGAPLLITTTTWNFTSILDEHYPDWAVVVTLTHTAGRFDHLESVQLRDGPTRVTR